MASIDNKERERDRKQRDSVERIEIALKMKSNETVWNTKNGENWKKERLMSMPMSVCVSELKNSFAAFYGCPSTM